MLYLSYLQYFYADKYAIKKINKQHILWYLD